MNKDDLFAVIEGRAKEYLGTEKGLEFAKTVTGDLISFLFNGLIPDIEGPLCHLVNSKVCQLSTSQRIILIG